jgi:hypothetical protein
LKIVLSVDTGKTGAYGLYYNKDGIQGIELHNLDHIGEFIEFAQELMWPLDPPEDEIIAIVEEPPPFTGNFSVPSSSGFKLGKSFGEVTGALRALDYPLQLVRPRDWQKGLSGLKGLKGHPRKKILADHARRLMPKAKITVRNADAALIAHYFYNNNLTQDTKI